MKDKLIVIAAGFIFVFFITSIIGIENYIENWKRTLIISVGFSFISVAITSVLFFKD